MEPEQSRSHPFETILKRIDASASAIDILHELRLTAHTLHLKGALKKAPNETTTLDDYLAREFQGLLKNEQFDAAIDILAQVDSLKCYCTLASELLCAAELKLSHEEYQSIQEKVRLFHNIHSSQVSSNDYCGNHEWRRVATFLEIPLATEKYGKERLLNKIQLEGITREIDERAREMSVLRMNTGTMFSQLGSAEYLTKYASPFDTSLLEHHKKLANAVLHLGESFLKLPVIIPRDSIEISEIVRILLNLRDSINSDSELQNRTAVFLRRLSIQHHVQDFPNAQPDERTLNCALLASYLGPEYEDCLKLQFESIRRQREAFESDSFFDYEIHQRLHYFFSNRLSEFNLLRDKDAQRGYLRRFLTELPHTTGIPPILFDRADTIESATALHELDLKCLTIGLRLELQTFLVPSEIDPQLVKTQGRLTTFQGNPMFMSNVQETFLARRVMKWASAIKCLCKAGHYEEAEESWSSYKQFGETIPQFWEYRSQRTWNDITLEAALGDKQYAISKVLSLLEQEKDISPNSLMYYLSEGLLLRHLKN